MDECQKRIQRAPSTICLLCASCRRRVTPCLVCAHLLPCCYCCCSPWLACSKCNVKNPIGDEGRRLLGFPPASALPPSMVRRVFIAYIGRPSCTMVTHLLHQRLQQALSRRKEGTGVGIGGVTSGKDSFTQSESSFGEMDLLNLSQIGLPFMQCEGIVTNAALPLPKQISDEKEEQLLLEGDNNAGGSCSDCSGNCKFACLNEVIIDNIDAALRRCQEQLVALHCAEAFSADSKCSAYPLCNTIIKSSLSIGEMKTCNTNMGCDCSLVGLGRGFSIAMLRMINSGFIKDFEVWLAKDHESSQESCKFEAILMTVEAFIEKQDQILDLKRSVLKAVAAQKQVAIDSKADMPTQFLFSTVCMLEQLFADRMKERMEKLTRAVEPFLSLLHQINLVLEFLYTRVCGAALLPQSFSLCTDAETVPGCTDKYLSDRHLQTAVSYWLLLYHDIAHATAVI